MTTQTETQIPMPGSMDINPDPTRYQNRLEATFNSETSETLGLSEAWWEPIEKEEAPSDRHKPLSLPRDLLGYEPLRLWFGMPHLAGCEKNDDWFEVLFSTLFELTEDLCGSVFGVGHLDASPGWGSPWADPDLSPAFLFYASEVARQDDRDGGWDAVLVHPRQRALLAQGVLAKALNEHVFSSLLFGGTAQQQDVLGQWDRIMLKEEGYVRKYRRCEELKFCLGGKRVVTPFFWGEVARITAQAAQMLLPLLNLQRTRLVADAQAEWTPSLPVFYQRLHDVVALAGYASLCMAWSTSIFQVEFPQPGMQWHIDQEREADDEVYAVSEAKALAAAGADKTAADDGFAFMHAARVKIVMWPRITRFKPQWNSRRTVIRRATKTILSKSHSAYYYGGHVAEVVGSESGDKAHDVDDDGSDCDSHGEDARAVDEDDELPYLHDYVDTVRAERRRSHTLWWARRLGAVSIVAGLLVWAFGLTFLTSMSLAELVRTIGLQDLSVAHFRTACTQFLHWLAVAVPDKVRGQLQSIRGVVGVSSV